MKNKKMRISSKPDQKSTTTYMLKQWTLVKPLPLEPGFCDTRPMKMVPHLWQGTKGKNPAWSL